MSMPKSYATVPSKISRSHSEFHEISRDLVGYFDWHYVLAIYYKNITENSRTWIKSNTTTCSCSWPGTARCCDPLQWRYNGRDGVSNHLRLHCSDADQRKLQRPASLAFVRGIHRWPVNSLHKGPVTRKMFPLDDVMPKNSLLKISSVKLIQI